MNIKRFVAAAMAVGTLGVAGSAEAMLITDCPITAIVCYQYDDAQAAVSLTGTPTRVGDDMQFLPAAFKAQSNGAGYVTAGPANFIFSRVWTPGGQEILNLVVTEEYDYRIITGSSVEADLYMQARSNLLSTDSMSNTWNFTRVGDSGGIKQGSLTGTLGTAAAFAQPANDMRVTIQETLYANAAPGQLAWIQKKFTLHSQTFVPVPATVWLLGSGLGLLGVIRRRQALS